MDRRNGYTVLKIVPWSADELGNRLYLLRRLGSFLPDYEAQLAFEFEQEVERLRIA